MNRQWMYTDRWRRVKKFGASALPSLHHRKEGWPSDQWNVAKPPLIARPGWFSDPSERKTTPSASASVASRNFIDDAATPPCGGARRGVCWRRISALRVGTYTANSSVTAPWGRNFHRTWTIKPACRLKSLLRTPDHITQESHWISTKTEALSYFAFGASVLEV